MAAAFAGHKVTWRGQVFSTEADRALGNGADRFARSVLARGLGRAEGLERAKGLQRVKGLGRAKGLAHGER